jgi:hypothetical protein
MNSKDKGSNAFYKDRKRLAWVVYSILKNNMVTPVLFNILLIFENLSLFICYALYSIRFQVTSIGENSG